MNLIGVNTQILGYILTEELHTGTKTLVYRGIRQSDATPVAIKLMQNEHPRFSDLVQFRNQYTIVKNLNLDGIIKPYNLEFYHNGYVLVMEDFGGISLAKYVKGLGDKEGCTLPIDQFFPIALQLADILHGLYRHRIIHKDLKPSNILINPETKQVKLADFSISSLLPRENQEIQNPNILEGTLAYLSPEQTGRMNRGIDYRTDFYSLGVTFFELLTGRLPFEAREPMEIVHCHLAKYPPLAHSINMELPPILSQIINKLMAKNAEDRYQSALGLQYDLEQCLSQWKETGKIAPFELRTKDISDRFVIPEKLYGRQTDVETLLAAFNRVAQGSSEIMLVAGFSGIGKTSVVNEIHKPIVQQRGYFIKGKFDQFQRNIPFSAFVQAFRDLIGQLLSETDAQLEQWNRQILTVLGENGQVLIDVIPELEQLIGKQPPVPELSGVAAQSRFNLLFQKFIQVFTTKEHPLVIFLDDLQWADLASLKLMQLLMSENETGYLLLIGAYRDNEVSPIHPLMLTLKEIKKTSAIVNEILLAPLALSSLNQLIADTLKCPSYLALILTKLIYQKTKGNPFYNNQFFKYLHQDGAIRFDINTDKWQFDIIQIQSLSLGNNVVEFMSLQLQKLPESTQKVIKLAACIGNQFDLATLSIICEQSQTETGASLWKALEEGFIIPINEVYKLYQIKRKTSNNGYREVDSEVPQNGHKTPIYKFLHDRVQQAAYCLTPEEARQENHLKIGRLLLLNNLANRQEEKIFDIVNQLNLGTELITETQERYELTQLNLLAAQKAKLSTAYNAAIAYLNSGINLLATESWDSHYELTLVLHKELAEVEYLNGNFEASEAWVNKTIEHAKTPLEKAEVYNILITQYTLKAEYPEAIAAGRRALSLIGINLPEDDELESAISAEIAEAIDFLGNRPLASLADLPVMTEPEKKMATKLLISIGPPTYRSHQRLWSVICAKAVNLCLKYGNTPETAYIYPAFGGLLGFALNNYQAARDLVEVTIHLTQQFNHPASQSTAYLMIGSSLRHWAYPLKASTQDYEASYHIGLESGNLQYAAYAFGHNMYCRFYQGVNLEQLDQEFSEYLLFSQKRKNQWAIDLIQGGLRIISSLMGIDTASTNNLTESEYLEQCRTHKNSQVICIYNILRSQILYLFNQPLEALQHSQAAESQLINVAPQGLLPLAEHRFIQSLIQAELYPQADAAKQQQYWENLTNNQQQLKRWADACPENFLHQYWLVTAEIARISGSRIEAIDAYDCAINFANQNDFTQNEALANELASQFYSEWGKERIAQEYMLNAYYAYARWGAKAKIDNLEQRYPHLLIPVIQKNKTPLTSDAITITAENITVSHSISDISTTSGSSALDLAAILKASQTLSSEIQLEKLLAKLLQLVIENAGADKCALLLLKEDKLAVEALTNIEQPPTLLQSLPLEECQELPIGLINIVRRTLETSVIINTKVHPSLMADPYILRQQPKSLLCMPILRQGNLLGVLYLENSLTTGAFTSDRVKILNLLCTQAAISLENARLYQQAQDALEHLKQMQLQLVQSEKMSALGNLVAGVAHEINNPVAFIMGNLAPAKDYIQDLFGLIDLYQQEYPESSAVIQDEIEAIELDYLREDLPKLIDSMSLGADRIRNISTSLRIFSRADKDYKVPFNLNDGIDSTILILKHRLKANDIRPAIEVVKDYGDLPTVECFPGQLNQVFMNLLANAIDALEESNKSRTLDAIKANPNQITIQTRLAENSQQVVIRIADNGVGMTEDVKQRIFDHLFTTKPVGEGTGLGLAIVRQIVVDKHQGTLEVNSSPSQGAEIVVTLPVKG